MIEILGLPAFSDNYIWLLLDAARKRCAVVDPGDAAPVLAWLHQNPCWDIEDILTTHHHNDHVGGVLELKQASGARVLGPAGENIPGRDVALNDGDGVTVLGLELQVIHVPGHTLGHIAFYNAKSPNQPTPLLFCGDTLFAAGCGRLFEGTPAQMHQSLQRFAALPDDTAMYCAHEYTLSNLRFAQAVEPDNLDIAQRFVEVSQWRLEGRPSVPSNMALEKRTNPFLRVDQPNVIRKLDERSGPHNGDLAAAFGTLRAWKDKF